MGMDVYGKQPLNEKGEYFRNNVWWWHPLADYCQQIAPDITSRGAHWHSNDGGGLDATSSLELANALRVEILSGRCAAYETKRTAELAALPDEPCRICAGTGSRPPVPHIGAGSTGECNGCNSTGKIRPFESQYPFSVSNVEEFITFLESCGGFEIC